MNDHQRAGQDLPRNDSVNRFWEKFGEACELNRKLSRREAGVPDEPYRSWTFGDEPGWSDELAELVVAGRKRATAKLRAEADQLDLAGGYRVVLDGAGRPRCVVLITDVEVRAFDQVDAVFARAEGEGDLSLAYWRRVHREFFGRRAAALGIPLSGQTPVVLTRFTKLWPGQNSCWPGAYRASSSRVQPHPEAGSGGDLQPAVRGRPSCRSCNCTSRFI